MKITSIPMIVSFLLFTTSFSRSDELEEIMLVPEAQRPELVVSMLSRYMAHFSTSTISFSTVETGTMLNHIKKEGENEPSSSAPINGRWVSEFVLSGGKRYSKAIQPSGETISVFYDGKRGTQYYYGLNHEMIFATQFCHLPNLFSRTAEHFVRITGISNFSSCSKEDSLGYTKSLAWGDRITDPKLGDCVVLKEEKKMGQFQLDRHSVYLGIRDSTLVVLRKESLSQLENELGVNGQRSLKRYKWLLDFEYGKSTGMLLPESWTYVISDEDCSLDGRLLPLGGLLQKNPLIIHATNTKIAQCKFLNKFPPELENIPIGPRVKVSNNCERKEQVQIAEKRKSDWPSSYWLLGLCIASCAIAVSVYVKNRRS